MSSSCAECKLFEIRGSIFRVGDPNLESLTQWTHNYSNIQLCVPGMLSIPLCPKKPFSGYHVISAIHALHPGRIQEHAPYCSHNLLTSHFRPKIYFSDYVSILLYKCSAGCLKHNGAIIISIPLSYAELNKNKAADVLIFLYGNISMFAISQWHRTT